MRTWLLERWKRFCSYRKLNKEVDPRTFHDLTQELTQLTRVIREILPRQNAFQNKLSQIEQEMAELERLTATAEFKRMNVKQKIELKRNLIRSRDQLLEAVQSAPTPTDFLQ